MGVLTPLFLAGMSLISLPIVLHLIRRSPRGRVLFSSLMFLEPSPPTMTKRSRIEHWLLLLLRALAVLLLAIAFSRPFWRASETESTEAPSRRVVVLLDTSASLRRTGLWQAALAKAEDVLKSVTPRDELLVATFDRQLHPLVSFSDWQALPSDNRVSVVMERLAQAGPTWNGTRLGTALTAVTELAALPGRETGSAAMASPPQTEIIVISDLQQGSHLESLQSYAWPEQVVVRPEFIVAQTEDNAGVHAIAGLSPTSLRVRVDNAPDAVSEKFTLKVETTTPVSATGNPTDIKPTTEPREVQLAAGQERVIAVGELPGAVCRVVLSGDSEAFDNVAWFVRPNRRRLLVRHFTDEAQDTPDNLRFFLSRGCLPTDERDVEFQVVTPTDSVLTGDRPALAIVSSLLSAKSSDYLRQQIQAGLTVLCVTMNAEQAQAAFALATGSDKPTVNEAQLSGYAMLTSVDFTHPLFAEFSDVKLSDFTKLPIWKHRLLGVTPPEARVLARFDGEAPALLELKSGQGRVIVSLFGWHGADSRFVLWSKFVPMLNHLLNSVPGTTSNPPRLLIGDRLISPDATAAQVRVTDPQGKEHDLTPATLTEFSLTEPGAYMLTAGARSETVAVNLDATESRTKPLSLDELRSAGIPLETQSPSARLEELRQLKSHELEHRQKLWQWLVLASLALLLAESYVAHRLTSRESLA